MDSLAEYWHRIERSLFPGLGDVLGDVLTPRIKQLAAVLEIVRVEEQRIYHRWRRYGRRPADRTAIARAFVAKAVLNVPDTKSLVEMLKQQDTLRQIVGWELVERVPSESTFSRAFAEFAKTSLGDLVHETLVTMHIGDRIIGHISRDATAIEAREKTNLRPKKQHATRRRRGRPRKGEVVVPRPEKRLSRQKTQTPEEAIAELPTLCDIGTKRNSKGNNCHWIGWKVHIDAADGGLPITVLTTSASMHDSQAAIPMAKRTAQRVTALYELMDAAYDADDIHEIVRSLGHKPIIDKHSHRKDKTAFDPATAQRFKERTNVERVFSRLKDEFGGRNLRVRGHAKVHLHIMFGVIALFADQLLKQLQC